jgi:predicted metalloprotease with PDZ domain
MNLITFGFTMRQNDVMPVFRKLVIVFVFCLSTFAYTATYTVVAVPDKKAVEIEVKLDRGNSKEFRMPAWAPGDYRLIQFGKYVKNIEFRLGESLVSFEKGSDPNHWKLSSPADTVTYTIDAVPAGPFTDNLRVRNDELFFQGPAIFGWFLGHDKEKHTLRVKKMSQLDAKVALRPLETSDEEHFIYSANDYDDLLDAPFVMGRLKTSSFIVGNKEHILVAYGRNNQVVLDSFTEVCKKVAEQCLLLFGEIPSERYYYFFDFGGPGGGLEHANSSRMGIWPGADGHHAAGLIAHEYFHLYNVKRIRPRQLGPFDYTQSVPIKTLWWLEGVTDYYADVLLYRSGLITQTEFWRSLAQTIRAIRNNPARLRVSPEESSLRVWESNTSSGYGIDYYDTGKIIGMCFDLLIRIESKNERSLDDILVALYNECKGNKPGYDEGRIRELLIQFGGVELGKLYDSIVLSPAEMPIEELLSKVGLQLRNNNIIPTDLERPLPIVARAWPSMVPLR